MNCGGSGDEMLLDKPTSTREGTAFYLNQIYHVISPTVEEQQDVEILVGSFNPSEKYEIQLG